MFIEEIIIIIRKDLFVFKFVVREDENCFLKFIGKLIYNLFFIFIKYKRVCYFLLCN